MAGTLLVYDEAFPRATAPSGPIRNTPSADELRDNNYPTPYRLLPIPQASQPDAYFAAMADAARAAGPLSRLIIFGPRRGADAARPGRRGGERCRAERRGQGDDGHHRGGLGPHRRERVGAARPARTLRAARAGRALGLRRGRGRPGGRARPRPPPPR